MDLLNTPEYELKIAFQLGISGLILQKPIFLSWFRLNCHLFSGRMWILLDTNDWILDAGYDMKISKRKIFGFFQFELRFKTLGSIHSRVLSFIEFDILNEIIQHNVHYKDNAL